MMNPDDASRASTLVSQAGQLTLQATEAYKEAKRLKKQLRSSTLAPQDRDELTKRLSAAEAQERQLDENAGALRSQADSLLDGPIKAKYGPQGGLSVSRSTAPVSSSGPVSFGAYNQGPPRFSAPWNQPLTGPFTPSGPSTERFGGPQPTTRPVATPGSSLATARSSHAGPSFLSSSGDFGEGPRTGQMEAFDYNSASWDELIRRSELAMTRMSEAGKEDRKADQFEAGNDYDNCQEALRRHMANNSSVQNPASSVGSSQDQFIAPAPPRRRRFPEAPAPVQSSAPPSSLASTSTHHHGMPMGYRALT